MGGIGVVVEIAVRRFRCENSSCPAVTFTEQIPGLARPHSRCTPLLSALTQIGLALSDRAGVRLAATLGMRVGRDTLLRLVRELPDPEPATVTALPVDDFAFHGQHYGTPLIDMDTHRPLDAFDGRDSEDLAAWLRKHPEVEVICRDRSSPATARAHGSGRRRQCRSPTASTCGRTLGRRWRRR
ncbi:hypothetical protein ACFY0A_41385 [Streptomyces sp. NPDC001698]|uniref:hypothetical protein n=1 Tax=Streptomyces sp. NPDC001698 TaxID=3364601 RepID=UPI0036BA3282